MKILDPSKLNLTSAILDHKVKSLYIASPHQGAGTTTCAYSLAKALSELISERVIIIDGNPGSNSLTEQMGLEGKMGFSDLNIPGYRESPQKAIHTLDNEPFHVIPAGVTPPSNPMGGERSELMRLIETLTENYSYVIYDGPPIHKHNEPLALAAAFDGVVLILKNNNTRIEVASSAKAKLTQAGANVIGAVYNRRRYYVPQWVYDLL